MVTCIPNMIGSLQELKDELSSRGLDTTGLKAVLVERLEEALRGSEDGDQANGAAEPSTTDAAGAEQPPPADAAAAAEPEAAPVRKRQQATCHAQGGCVLQQCL